MSEGFDDNYVAGEIWSEHVRFGLINHEISVVGYSKDPTTGEEYWIGRNSWGTYWGMQGFFYITMDPYYNLSIDKDCIAGNVTYTKPVTSTQDIFTQ